MTTIPISVLARVCREARTDNRMNDIATALLRAQDEPPPLSEPPDCAPPACQGFTIYDWEWYYFGCWREPCNPPW